LLGRRASLLAALEAQIPDCSTDRRGLVRGRTENQQNCV